MIARAAEPEGIDPEAAGQNRMRSWVPRGAGRNSSPMPKPCVARRSSGSRTVQFFGLRRCREGRLLGRCRVTKNSAANFFRKFLIFCVTNASFGRSFVEFRGGAP